MSLILANLISSKLKVLVSSKLAGADAETIAQSNRDTDQFAQAIAQAIQEYLRTNVTTIPVVSAVAPAPGGAPHAHVITSINLLPR